MLYTKSSIMVLIIALVPVWSAHATPITIDFEGFPTGSFTAGVEDGVSITGAGGPPQLVSNLPPFTSGNGAVQDGLPRGARSRSHS